MPANRFSTTGLQAEKYLAIQKQARRYMEGVYGEKVWFQAPEVEDNILIRWIRAVAEGNIDAAEMYMRRIEALIAEHRDTEGR